MWNNLPLYKKIRVYGSNLDASVKDYVDKINSKNIVQNILGDKISIPKIIRILKNPDDITTNDINPNHLLKASHGSGWMIDFEEEQDINKIKTKLKDWNRIYSKTEKQYMYLEPRFFIEEKINCLYKGKTGLANDIKIHCFHGKAQMIMLRENINGKLYKNHYDISLNPFGKDIDNFQVIQFNKELPNNIYDIINMAEILSKPFNYVRMDFYVGDDNKVYFSEYTFTHNAGHRKLSEKLELYLGSFWKEV